MNSDLAAEEFDLEEPRMVGRGEYDHVLDWLGLQILNAREEGEPFGREEALATLRELRDEIDGVVKTLEKQQL